MTNNVPAPSMTSLRTESDDILLQRISLREESEALAKAAFQVFYERYEKFLFAVSRQVCSKFPKYANELFEAVFQNTFMQVYLRAETFDVNQIKSSDLSVGVKAWIGSIADNEHKKLLRELRKAPDIHLADDIPIAENELENIPVEENYNTPESYQRTILDQALASLNDIERYILINSIAYEQEGKYLPSSFIDSTCKLWQITRVNFRKIKSIAWKKVFAKIDQLLTKTID